jgi:hypothetical protein
MNLFKSIPSIKKVLSDSKVRGWNKALDVVEQVQQVRVMREDSCIPSGSH